MKTLEIRTDILSGGDLIPHTFLFVNGKGYGFAPVETGLTGAGKVWDNTSHPYNESLTRTIQITEAQYQSLMDGIDIAKVDPPFYSILGGAQCTTWAMEQLNDAGIIRSDVRVGTSDYFTNFVETLQNNPYTQGLPQHKGNIEVQMATVLDSIIKTVVDSVEQDVNNFIDWLGIQKNNMQQSLNELSLTMHELLANNPIDKFTSQTADQALKNWQNQDILDLNDQGKWVVNTPDVDFNDIGDLFNAEKAMRQELKDGWITS